jgi:peptide/nickel transport system permease protein
LTARHDRALRRRALPADVPTLLVITALVFGLILIIPGDPVMAMLGYVPDERSAVSPEVYARMRERLGLDQPLYVQYLRWLGRAVQGDLGTSVVTGQPVLNLIVSRLPATVYLATASLALALLLAIPGGLWAAVRRNTVVDHAATGFVLFGICTPSFWVALLLVLVFSVWLGWLPSIGYVPPEQDFGRFLLHLAMPTAILGTEVAAQILRFVRTEFLEQLHQDYVRTARAKGLSERVVVLKHSLRNALTPIITLGALEFGTLLSGAVLTEQVFTIPGFGKLIVDAVFNRDYAVVQGVVLVTASAYIALNLLADIAYVAVNPRLRG